MSDNTHMAPPVTPVTPSGGLRTTVAYALRDPSAWMLLASNAATITLALTQHWSLIVIMWIYWWQSVVIGFFNFLRILTLQDYSTEGFTMNDRPVQPTPSAKVGAAFFFAFHYGFFHLVYAIFLVVFSLVGFLGEPIDPGPTAPVSLPAVFLTGIGFAANHLYSFVHNRERDAKGRNIGQVMAAPYARIVPMHLTIILGAFLHGATLPFFLLLKAAADVVMHVREHASPGAA